MIRKRSPLKAVVTYLEQRERPKLTAPMPVNLHVALMRQEKMPLHFYRYLQYRIGREWHWVARLRLDNAALAALVHSDETTIDVLYLNGAPTGLFELRQHTDNSVNIEYFGMMGHAHGMGLGRWFLKQAIDAAWELNPYKVTINTCTLDHPAALPLYQKFGFVPIGQSDTFIHPLTDDDLLKLIKTD